MRYAPWAPVVGGIGLLVLIIDTVAKAGANVSTLAIGVLLFAIVLALSGKLGSSER